MFKVAELALALEGDGGLELELAKREKNPDRFEIVLLIDGAAVCELRVVVETERLEDAAECTLGSRDDSVEVAGVA